jgi:hypothetical protein
MVGCLRFGRRVAVAVGVVTLVASVCSSGGGHALNRPSPSRSLSATASAAPPAVSTAPPRVPSPSPRPSSCPPASPRAAAPSPAQALLTRLQTAPFDGSGLPARLHVAGVGVWQYFDAGHVGAGYVGSAQVCLRSDLAGESIDAFYDVFTADADASAEFDRAYANFHRYGPAGRFQLLHLNPPVRAFCSAQASGDAICWFVRGLASGIVTATVPASVDRGDGPAVLQAMLTHLIALGG